MGGKSKKFELPDDRDSGLKSIKEIDEQVDKVLKDKASFFAGPSREIQLSKISINPNQPRKHIDPIKFAELKQSIEADGLIEPIVIRPFKEGTYQIVCGERRYRAAIELGWVDIDAVIKDIDENKAFELALAENLQREDLSPIEIAEAFQHMIDTGIAKNQSELAQKLGVTRQAVSYKISLLSLPSPIKTILSTRVDKITEGHLRNFPKLESEELMTKLATKIIDEDLSVKATEGLIANILNGTFTLSGSSSTGVSRSRTITNPSKPIRISEENKNQGIWVKHTGQKLIVEAKGATPGKENDPKVIKALDALYIALYT